MNKKNTDGFTKTSPYFLGFGRACAFTSLAASTIKRLEKAGEFPKSVPIGKRRKAYVRDEVVSWCEQRVALNRGKT